MTGHCRQLLIHDGVDFDHSIRPVGTGFHKTVKAVGKNRILCGDGGIFAEMGHHTGVGAIHDQLCRRPVIGMIVTQTVGDDQIRVPAADDAHQFDPVVKGGFKAAILLSDDLIFCDTGSDTGLPGFFDTDPGCFFPGKTEVSGVSIGGGNKFDFVTGTGQLDGSAAAEDISIIGK